MAIITGTPQNDSLTGNANENDQISALGGDDVILIESYSSEDTVDGGAGADSLTLNWNYEDNLHYLTYGLKKADGTWAYFSAGGDQDMAAASLSEIRQVLADGVQQQSYQDKYHWYAGWWYGRTDFSGIEVLNVQGSSWSDLLVYNGGVQTLSGNAGTDTLYLDLSGWTSAVSWVNDGTAKSFINGSDSLSVSGVEQLLLQTGSGNDLVDNRANGTGDQILTGAGDDTVYAVGGGYGHIETGTGNDIVVG